MKRVVLAELPMPKKLELAIEAIILASRWLLVIFYVGLAIALGLYAVSFGIKLFTFFTSIFSLDDADAILKMLGLIDAALVASLVVMVNIFGYESYVSRFDNEGSVHWLGEIDAGSLKIKVASTIIAISSIHLLQVFLTSRNTRSKSSSGSPSSTSPSWYRRCFSPGLIASAPRQS